VKSANVVRDRVEYDRDIFFVVILIALALSLNAQGLIAWVYAHSSIASWIRLPAMMAALGLGGIVGLFSARIASHLTAWLNGR